MDNSIILALITFVGGIITIWIKSNSDNKKFSIKEDLLRQEINEHGTALAKLEISNTRLIEGEKFRMDFRNAMAKMASSKINNSEIFGHSEIYSKAITDFAAAITEFGIKFNYSDLRKSKETSTSDFKLYLQSDINSIIFDFLNVLKNGITEIKAHNINGKLTPYTLTGYIINMDIVSRDPGCMKLTDLLVERLIQNGFDEVELQKTFINYLDNFISKFKERVQGFSILVDYDKEIDNISNKNERFKM